MELLGGIGLVLEAGVVDVVLQAEQLPAGVTDAQAGLAHLDYYYLTH